MPCWSGGDREQVVARIADLYIERRDVLRATGSKRGISISAPTNDDAAEISQAVRRAAEGAGRDRRRRGGLQGDRPARADLRPGRSPPATGCGCSDAPGARSTARPARSATTATSWRCSARAATGCALRTKDGRIAEVEWRRLADDATGRLLLGFGHALTIDAAQGITSDEHINALPRGTSGGHRLSPATSPKAAAAAPPGR